MTTCLVVCPRNTVLNWYKELNMWQSDLDFKVKVWSLLLYTYVYLVSLHPNTMTLYISKHMLLNYIYETNL